MGRLASVLVSQQVVDLWAHSCHHTPNVKSTASKNHRFSIVGRLIHEAQDLRVKRQRVLQVTHKYLPTYVPSIKHFSETTIPARA
jgi:hypothetical protein